MKKLLVMSTMLVSAITMGGCASTGDLAKVQSQQMMRKLNRQQRMRRLPRRHLMRPR